MITTTLFALLIGAQATVQDYDDAIAKLTEEIKVFRPAWPKLPPDQDKQFLTELGQVKSLRENAKQLEEQMSALLKELKANRLNVPPDYPFLPEPQAARDSNLDQDAPESDEIKNKRYRWELHRQTLNLLRQQAGLSIYIGRLSAFVAAAKHTLTKDAVPAPPMPDELTIVAAEEWTFQDGLRLFYARNNEYGTDLGLWSWSDTEILVQPGRPVRFKGLSASKKWFIYTRTADCRLYLLATLQLTKDGFTATTEKTLIEKGCYLLPFWNYLIEPTPGMDAFRLPFSAPLLEERLPRPRVLPQGQPIEAKRILANH